MNESGLVKSLLNESTCKTLGIPQEAIQHLCVGFGTDYCMTCDYYELIPSACPMNKGTNCECCPLKCPCNRSYKCEEIEKCLGRFENSSVSIIT